VRVKEGRNDKGFGKTRARFNLAKNASFTKEEKEIRKIPPFSAVFKNRLCASHPKTAEKWWKLSAQGRKGRSDRMRHRGR